MRERLSFVMLAARMLATPAGAQPPGASRGFRMPAWDASRLVRQEGPRAAAWLPVVAASCRGTTAGVSSATTTASARPSTGSSSRLWVRSLASSRPGPHVAGGAGCPAPALATAAGPPDSGGEGCSWQLSLRAGERARVACRRVRARSHDRGCAALPCSRGGYTDAPSGLLTGGASRGRVMVQLAGCPSHAEPHEKGRVYV